VESETMPWFLIVAFYQATTGKLHVETVRAALLTCAAHACPVMAIQDIQQSLCCCRPLGIDGYREKVQVPRWVVTQDVIKQTCLVSVLSAAAEAAAGAHAHQ
jgi:hypothetical protein